MNNYGKIKVKEILNGLSFVGISNGSTNGTAQINNFSIMEISDFMAQNERFGIGLWNFNGNFQNFGLVKINTLGSALINNSKIENSGLILLYNCSVGFYSNSNFENLEEGEMIILNTQHPFRSDSLFTNLGELEIGVSTK